MESSNKIRRSGPSVRVVACAFLFGCFLPGSVDGLEVVADSGASDCGSDIFLSALPSAGEAQ